jgi:hypothetical protein
VPQQLLVFEVERVESFVFTLALQLKAVQNVDIAAALRIFHVLLNHFEVSARLWQRLDLALQVVVLGVDRILLKLLVAGLLPFLGRGTALCLLASGSLERNVDVNKRLDEVDLLIEFVHIIDNVPCHVAATEVVRNERIEFAAQLLHDDSLRSRRDLATGGRQRGLDLLEVLIALLDGLVSKLT